MAAGQPGAELHNLLMGAGTGQLNLAAVSRRAEELKRSLEAIIQNLQFAADRVQWSDMLDRYAVVNVQYQHLQDALRPLLRQFAAYPRSVNQTNAPILPIMLATKLLPEMEGEEQALLAALAAERGGSAGAASTPLSLAEQIVWVQDQERELNYLIEKAVASVAASKLASSGGGGGGSTTAARQAAAPAQHKPQPAGVARLAGAPGKQPPPDPLLAAVTFGAGLS